MEIVIEISTLGEIIYLTANDKDKFVTLNKARVAYDPRVFIEKLKYILLSWATLYRNPLGMIDGEVCSVKLSTPSKTRTYLCDNAFPENYNEFKELILEVKKAYENN